MSSDNIEIIIRIPTTSPLTKELVEVLGKVASQSQVTQKPKTQLTPEQEAKKKKIEKELSELKSLLEIATARGQKSVVEETQQKIRELEKELAAL